jgi:hypothetical protein
VATKSKARNKRDALLDPDQSLKNLKTDYCPEVQYPNLDIQVLLLLKTIQEHVKVNEPFVRTPTM